jgi:hypothetical protein
MTVPPGLARFSFWFFAGTQKKVAPFLGPRNKEAIVAGRQERRCKMQLQAPERLAKRCREQLLKRVKVIACQRPLCYFPIVHLQSQKTRFALSFSGQPQRLQNYALKRIGSRGRTVFPYTQI